MITVSLCIIVKNEEKVLGRCLESAKAIADEIIVVDTGSQDKTAEIAAQYTDRVLHFDWTDDFSAARNFSFSHATMDYILWLDADDVMETCDRDAFIRLKEELDPETAMVMMKYNIGVDAEGNATLSYYRERLMRRNMNFVWYDPIHESIPPRGKILYSDIAVTHRKEYRNDPGRNLRIYRKLLSSGGILTPRQQFYYARELYYAKEYAAAAEAFTDFLDGGEGWKENCINACQDLAACYRCMAQEKEELAALLRSFTYDLPRAELCCDIGEYFMRCGKFDSAVYWYQSAISRPCSQEDGGFKTPDCYGFIPYLQLCVCYDRLGDLESSERCNELAGKYKPNDAGVAYNRKYFASKKLSRGEKKN